MTRRIVLAFALALPCLAQLPEPALTPGVVRTSDAKQICAKSFRTKPYRLTTKAMKVSVCKAYGVKPCPKAGRLEIDHLIPLELGGLDDVKNLWPQMAKYSDGSPGFHVKDKLENELHRKVCAGEMQLSDAQACLARNWISCYHNVVEGQ